MNTETDTAGRVKTAMEEADRSQKWTAEKSGIAISTFRRKLAGGADFTVSEVGRIARSLKIPPSELLPPEWVIDLADAA